MQAGIKDVASDIFICFPKDKIYPLQMSVEEAVKLVISGGAVLPQDRVEFREEGARILGEKAEKRIED